AARETRRSIGFLDCGDNGGLCLTLSARAVSATFPAWQITNPGLNWQGMRRYRAALSVRVPALIQIPLPFDPHPTNSLICLASARVPYQSLPLRKVGPLKSKPPFVRANLLFAPIWHCVHWGYFKLMFYAFRR